MEERHAIAPLPSSSAVCIGAFDGVHRGHRSLVQAARGLDGVEHVAVLTFDPNPAAVLRSGPVPPPLQHPRQRRAAWAHLGVNPLVVLPFTRALAQTPADTFARDILLQGLQPRAIVVGTDFRFGQRRAGTIDLLRELAAEVDVAVVAQDLQVDAQGAKLSSSGLRVAVEAGDAAAASAVLGHPYGVIGTVVHGHKRGRELGFPTANLGAVHQLAPALGIYASYLRVLDRAHPRAGELLPAVTSVGKNPTFVEGEGAPTTIETYVLDLDLGESLYDLDVEVLFVQRLRGERAFESVTTLVEWIRDDIERARPILSAAHLAELPKVELE